MEPTALSLASRAGRLVWEDASVDDCDGAAARDEGNSFMSISLNTSFPDSRLVPTTWAAADSGRLIRMML